MKRFYKQAGWTVDAVTGMRSILLDGRPVRTPARAPLAVPGDALAGAIAAEWGAQQDDIDPASMPMTGLANATIDRVLPDAAGFARGIAAYGASDLLCYRASDPTPLVQLQTEAWNPLLDWARGRYGVVFAVTDGIMPVDQPGATVEALGAAVAALDPWLLAGLSNIVSLGGTLVGALALIEGAVDAGTLWDAVQIDEDWQARQWGEDADALARARARRVQFEDAAQYCALALRDGTALQA